MNSMTIFKLSRFSGSDGVVKIKYLKLYKKLLIINKQGRIHKAIDKYGRLH